MTFLRLTRAATAVLLMCAGIACDSVGGVHTTILERARSPKAALQQPADFIVSHCGLMHVVDFDGSYWDVDPETMTRGESEVRHQQRSRHPRPREWGAGDI